MQAAARLPIPNIVTAFDAGEHDGVHFFVMEYVEGVNLNALVKSEGPLTVPVSVEFVLQAARGLAYAHGKGVVHRDIKPSNLLVDRDGNMKILDMGLVRCVEMDKDDGEQLTTSRVMGTVHYMAPEQAMNSRRADARLTFTAWAARFITCSRAEPL